MNERQRLIQIVHVAKSKLMLDDETYKATLFRIGKKTSCSDLTVPELRRVLEHFERSGFKVRHKTKPPGKGHSRPLAQDLDSRKVRALWLFLHELGAIKNPSEEALAAYVKRITGVDALPWTRGDDITRLIETMKKWALRFLPQAVEALVPRVTALDLPDAEQRRINDLLNVAFTRRTFEPMQSAWYALQEVLKRAAS